MSEAKESNTFKSFFFPTPFFIYFSVYPLASIFKNHIGMYFCDSLGALHFQQLGYLSKVTGSLSDEYQCSRTDIKSNIFHSH